MEYSIKDKELNEYLRNLKCKGCYNQCPLDNPNCGKSKIFIKEAIEKFKKKEKECF